MKSLLIQFHCASNTGYAIGRLEPVFFEMAMRLLGGDSSRLHIAYSDLSAGPSPTLPAEFKNYLKIDAEGGDFQHFKQVAKYIEANQIDTVYGFDQPTRRKIYRHYRKAGVKNFISYCGAPMSSLNTGPKLWLKKLENWLNLTGPDQYIFESHGMAKTATHGRGVAKSKVHVVYLGVDSQQFAPNKADAAYVYEQFNIPIDRKIFFFSGHMEPRKGPQVIMQAANVLRELRDKNDWHILMLGNQPGQDAALLSLLDAPDVKSHVTFGGYRNDVAELHRGCYAGIIASTGWDSLTCSSLEMQSSGLPLLLSNLIGLNEAIVDKRTGFLFQPGDRVGLASLMCALLDDPDLRDSCGARARARIVSEFSIEKQVALLVDVVAAHSCAR